MGVETQTNQCTCKVNSDHGAWRRRVSSFDVKPGVRLGQAGSGWVKQSLTDLRVSPVSTKHGLNLGCTIAWRQLFEL